MRETKRNKFFRLSSLLITKQRQSKSVAWLLQKGKRRKSCKKIKFVVWGGHMVRLTRRSVCSWPRALSSNLLLWQQRSNCLETYCCCICPCFISHLQLLEQIIAQEALHLELRTRFKNTRLIIFSFILHHHLDQENLVK